MYLQDDRAPYSCPEQPRHLGAYVNNLGYQYVLILTIIDHLIEDCGTRR